MIDFYFIGLPFWKTISGYLYFKVSHNFPSVGYPKLFLLMEVWGYIWWGFHKNQREILKIHCALWPPKFDWAIKKSKFNFVVEYPTWVSIKRYLTGKLALACQIWIYCIRLKENVQKHLKIVVFWKRSVLDGFWTFLFKRRQ